jgi:hypothetical protein
MMMRQGEANKAGVDEADKDDTGSKTGDGIGADEDETGPDEDKAGADKSDMVVGRADIAGADTESKTEGKMEGIGEIDPHEVSAKQVV